MEANETGGTSGIPPLTTSASALLQRLDEMRQAVLLSQEAYDQLRGMIEHAGRLEQGLGELLQSHVDLADEFSRCLSSIEGSVAQLLGKQPAPPSAPPQAVLEADQHDKAVVIQDFVPTHASIGEGGVTLGGYVEKSSPRTPSESSIDESARTSSPEQ